jgi:hypothetical protein
MRQTLIATPGEERMEVRYPGTSMVTRLEMNKRIVREFYNLAFNERNPAEAAAKYVAESYRQHNPTVGDGPEGFVNGIGGFLNNVPDLRVDFKRFIAEGHLPRQERQDRRALGRDAGSPGERCKREHDVLKRAHGFARRSLSFAITATGVGSTFRSTAR